MAAGELHVTIDRGETWDKTIKFTAADGTPVDLTDASIHWELSDSYDVPPYFKATIGKGIIPKDLSQGAFRIRMESEETMEIPFGHGIHECKIIFADKTVRKIFKGEAEILRGIDG